MVVAGEPDVDRMTPATTATNYFSIYIRVLVSDRGEDSMGRRVHP